jgi:hypothetical protein
MDASGFPAKQDKRKITPFVLFYFYTNRCPAGSPVALECDRSKSASFNMDA